MVGWTKARRGVTKVVKKAAPGAEADSEQVDQDFMTIGKGGKALNLTTEGVFRSLREIFEQRGRKVGRMSSSRDNG